MIAHSHGGNVLLSALFRCQRGLKHLKSWATVGTPFYRFNQSIIVRSVLIPYLILGVVIALLMGFGILFTSVVEIVDADWLETHRSYLKWVFYFLAFVFFSTLVFMMTQMISKVEQMGPVAEAKLDERLRKAAAHDWNYPWVSIWSTEDEAITGLSVVGQFNKPFIGRVEPYSRDSFFSVTKKNGIYWGKYGVHRKQMGLFNALAGKSMACVGRVATRIYEFLTLWIWNKLIFPRSERHITSICRAMAFGDDTLDTVIKDVRSSPFDFDQDVPAIPFEITHSMVEKANRGLQGSPLLTQARSLLAQATFGGMTPEQMKGVISKTLTGDELIHTTYFTRDEIVEMLALHIESSRGESPTSSHPEIKKWVTEFYIRTGQDPH